MREISMNAAFNAPMSKGTVRVMSLEKYFELTSNEQLAALVNQIRQTDDEKERRKLKTNLPIRCPHYFHFRDNHRAQDAIIPEEFTFQTCVDIDEVKDVEPAIKRAFELDKQEGTWKGMLLHVERSASNKAHFDIRIPVGMTIEEAQKAYTKALDVAYDSKCTTPERMIYISDAASQIYTADGWYARLSDEELAVRRKAYADRGLDIDGRKPGNGLSSSKAENGQMVQELENQPSSAYPTEYNGIPYSLIVEVLTDQMGGKPEHGNRNDFIYAMVCHLRHICNNDPKWIRQIQPNFGEDQSRVDQTIENACKYSKSMTMSQMMKSVLWCAGERVRTDSNSDDYLNRQPQMPLRLPQPLRHLVSKAPKGYWPAIINASFPAFATYTGGVKLEYYNNTEMEATQMGNLVADSSTGKSCIKEPLKCILRPIKEKDRLNRERDKQWAEDSKTKSANKDKPARPKDICVQYINSDTTKAALSILSEDAERAGNKALFIKMDEIEMCYELAGGKKQNVTQLMRRNFDTDEFGQERASAEAVKVNTLLRTNMMISTTPENAKKFYTDQIGNGTLSRLAISTIVKEDVDELPKFGKYDEKYYQKLLPYLDRLDKAEGTIVCKQAKRLSEELIRLVNDRASLMDSNAYSSLGYRAVEIAFRKICLLYIMNDCKWSKDFDDFMRYLFEYDMWCKMNIFGEMAAKAFGDKKAVAKHRGPANLLDMLEDCFSREELAKVRKKQNNKDDSKGVTELLSQWKRRGFIEPVNNETGCKEFKKTESYLSRRAA